MLELQRQQQAQLLELEHQEMKLKQEKQFQAQQEALKREQAKKQIQSHQQLQGMHFLLIKNRKKQYNFSSIFFNLINLAQIHNQQLTIEKQHAMLIAQQNQKNLEAEHKKDELIALANISNNISNIVHQQQFQNQNPPTVNVIPTATVIPPTSAIVPGQVISNAPLITTSNIIADQQAPLIATNTINPINPLNSNSILNPNFNQCQTNFPQTQMFTQQQPIVHNIMPTIPGFGKELPIIPSMSNAIMTSQFDNFAPTGIRTIRPLRPTLSLGASNRLSKKDKRRLPLPTYEEIQQATVALGLNNRLSGLSCEKVVRIYIFNKI